MDNIAPFYESYRALSESYRALSESYKPLYQSYRPLYQSYRALLIHAYLEGLVKQLDRDLGVAVVEVGGAHVVEALGFPALVAELPQGLGFRVQSLGFRV